MPNLPYHLQSTAMLLQALVRQSISIKKRFSSTLMQRQIEIKNELMERGHSASKIYQFIQFAKEFR